MHEYRATMLRVVDGDTVDVDIDLGFGVWLRKQRITIVWYRYTRKSHKRLRRKALRKSSKELYQRQTTSRHCV